MRIRAIAGAPVNSSARGHDYPYCLQGRETGYPGECLYRTYQECEASASGRDAFCGANPRFANGQQQRFGRDGRQDWWR
jgi:hypothetical protein